jgi:hypothetical protein
MGNTDSGSPNMYFNLLENGENMSLQCKLKACVDEDNIEEIGGYTVFDCSCYNSNNEYEYPCLTHENFTFSEIKHDKYGKPCSMTGPHGDEFKFVSQSSIISGVSII